MANEGNGNEYLKAAAEAVEMQVLNNPGLGVPVDPDVADFMGAFQSGEDLGDVLEASDGE